MTERKPPGVSFETWVDSQIARSQERGDFENLPGAGSPLPRDALSENAYDWVLAKARREGVQTADMLPPGLRLRRERDELPERAARLASEAEVRALAEDYNARVEAFWRLPAESRWAPVPGLADVDALVAGWLATRPPTPPPAPPPEPARRTRRLFRPADGPDRPTCVDRVQGCATFLTRTAHPCTLSGTARCGEIAGRPAVGRDRTG